MSAERIIATDKNQERLIRILKRLADFQVTPYTEYAQGVLRFPLMPAFLRRSALRMRTEEVINLDHQTDKIENK
jgi:hypothetical protein